MRAQERGEDKALRRDLRPPCLEGVLERAREKMAMHDKSQIRVNWYMMTQGGEMACKTRKKVYAVSEELGKAVDAKIDDGCEHIIKPIALVFRTQTERATRMYKDRIQTIVNEAVPQTPNPTKTVHVHRKGREMYKRTKPDGTVEEVTREFEEDLDIPADVWMESEKKKPKTDQPDNAIGS